MKNKIVVEIDCPLDDTISSMGIIEKFLNVNKIKMNLSIAYDYSMDLMGLYIPNEKDHKFRIFINPLMCKEIKQEYSLTFDGDNNFCPGSNFDRTLFSATIHEFCHLLQYQIYDTIISDYKQKFQIDRLILNDYSNVNIMEELAEIMTLYMTNPYLLKMISKEHFKFIKSYFKSPVECSMDKCMDIYKGFPITIKKFIEANWFIYYNAKLDRLEFN
ncbi:MAG TPA: hypothetical protein DCS19_09385 [Flavobacterium sp.]|nr:hypothetical protein [Flavobacterium sp.]